MSRSCTGSPNQRGGGPPLPIVRQRGHGHTSGVAWAVQQTALLAKAPDQGASTWTTSEPFPAGPPRGGRLAARLLPRSSRATGSSRPVQSIGEGGVGGIMDNRRTRGRWRGWRTPLN